MKMWSVARTVMKELQDLKRYNKKSNSGKFTFAEEWFHLVVVALFLAYLIFFD